jgi:hypothetical protein
MDARKGTESNFTAPESENCARKLTQAQAVTVKS